MYCYIAIYIINPGLDASPIDTKVSLYIYVCQCWGIRPPSGILLGAIKVNPIHSAPNTTKTSMRRPESLQQRAIALAASVPRVGSWRHCRS